MTGYSFFRSVVLSSVLCGSLCGAHTNSPVFFKSQLIEIKSELGSFRLFYKGLPFVVKGGAVTGAKYLPYIKALGGNSVRTYTTVDAQQVLDTSEKLGLKVMLGLPVEYAYKDYYPDDQHSRDSVWKEVKKQVLKYKDHPALMFWSLGNEITLFMKSGLGELDKHILLWKFIDELAVKIHEIDPIHPVTTGITRRGFKTRRLIDAFAPHLDFLTFNSAESLEDDELPFSCKRPFLIGELASPAYWLNDRTEWYARIEPSSFEKCRFINHESGIYKSSGSMGSYAFYWGQKQEYTSTWFSLFTEKGELTEVGYNFRNIWLGKTEHSSDSIITISNLILQNKTAKKNIYVKAGQACSIRFDLEGSDVENALIRWELLSDEVDYLGASYFPNRSPVVDQDSVANKSFSISAAGIKKRSKTLFNPALFAAPKTEGAYRLFFYIKNKRTGIVSTANTCFYVTE